MSVLIIFVGAKIPWGVGKLAGQSIPKSTSTFSMSPAMASAAEKNAAVVIAVSNGTPTNDVPYMFIYSMILLGSFLFIL